jgi:hypothetical protein
MRKIATSLLVFMVSCGAFAQQTGHNEKDGHNHGNKPVIAEMIPNTEEVLLLKETEHDFSTIPQGKPVYYSFTIVNTGKTALKLDDVHASCGCTTPEWSREQIAPGATAKIKVGYNAAAEGYFEKFITITYNANQTKQIKIKGTVWKVPEGSAPANTSVDFLKKQSF